MKRYLLSELRSEREQLPLHDHPDRRWTSILTDGRVWHAWLYDHAEGAIAQQVLDNFRPHEPEQLLARLDPDSAANEPFWIELDALYRELRGQGRSTPTSLIDRINYNAALAIQPTVPATHRTLVLHPASGNIMRGARIAPGHAILQDAIHYFRARTSTEAAFLVALLNAPCLARAFLDSRTSGHHFKNNPWRAIPLPRYDRNSPPHRRLVTLCKRAEQAAAAWLTNQTRSFGQIAASTSIRHQLAQTGILDSIDDAARQILPDHAQTP